MITEQEKQELRELCKKNTEELLPLFRESLNKVMTPDLAKALGEDNI